MPITIWVSRLACRERARYLKWTTIWQILSSMTIWGTQSSRGSNDRLFTTSTWTPINNKANFKANDTQKPANCEACPIWKSLAHHLRTTNEANSHKTASHLSTMNQSRTTKPWRTSWAYSDKLTKFCLNALIKVPSSLHIHRPKPLKISP